MQSQSKDSTLLTKDNLEDFLSTLSLEPLAYIENPHNLLHSFKCTKNKDLEEFLHSKALDFGKRGTSKTHLLIKDDVVIGYFTLSMKPILTEGISKEVIKKIDGFSKNRKCIYFYLIGQLGLHDDYIGKGIGEFLLFNAINLIEQAHVNIGGRYILVDAYACDPVIHFYERNGFTSLVTEDENSSSVKMIYKI
jgi:GNAT superfamily N-acetyltransferase